MDIAQVKSIHFVGIKGVAMTALAIVAKEMGIKVTGSDVADIFPTDETLKRFSITYSDGFSPDHLSRDTDLVVHTGAHQGAGNIEVQTALQKGIDVLPHGKALGLFMEGKRGISVAGSHGKTTTSSLIAHVLTKLGKDPSFAIGCGGITSLSTPAHAGSGEFFVAEADEYVTDPTGDPTPRFMWQKPDLAVITNIDFDHPDVFADIRAVKQAFISFINQMPASGKVILGTDSEHAVSIVGSINHKPTTYGKTHAQFTYRNLQVVNQQTSFDVYEKDSIIGQFTIRVPGEHNVANAVGAIAALITLGFKAEELLQPLASFTGTKRRFEKIVEKNGKLLFDDYAHHPAEIRATLEAARSWFPERRITVIFQPHTFTRTKTLLHDFADAFKTADRVVLTDIYASARENPIPGFTGNDLVEQVAKHQKDVFYAPKCPDVIQYILTQTSANDVILTMGAGDIYSWLSQISESL